MPDDFCDALIVSLYKKKGSNSDCGNYRSISLLSVAGKIFARVILNRLILVFEQTLPEAQSGFRLIRSTVDMIFTVRQLQEKCIEQNKPLYLVFIDLTNAFNTINREALWTVLERIRCPPKLVSMIRLFHDGLTSQVLSNGNVTDAFVISNGVKQGCVLPPVLFNVFFPCMLSHAVQDLEKGVYIRYCLDGSLFDLHRFTEKTKSLQTLLQEVLFADNCALVAHTEQDRQQMLDCFSEASKLSEKTEVLHQPAPYPTHSPTITTDDKPLANVEHFKYLGSTISCDGSLDRKIASRISKASQALGSLRNRVLSEHNIRLSMKLKVYSAVVLSSLFYGCETWKLYRRNIKKLELFHMRALHSMRGIRWQDHITNLEVLDKTKSTSIEVTIIKAQLRWVGHVIRTEECRMPRRLMYEELQAGKRNQGRPKLRYKDTVRANPQWCHINPRDLEGYAVDRPKWQGSVHTAAANFKD